MNIDEYIALHISPEPPELAEVDRRTQLQLFNPRMCSGHLQGRLLTMLTRMQHPRLALELGTYSAYATLCIAEGLPAGSVLHTVEANDELEDFIKSSLALSPYGAAVRTHFGKALQLLDSIEEGETFDFVFIDADKREYPDYYRALKPRMAKGALIVADNTLWDGHVIEPEHNDAQTRGICEFNDIVAADPDVETVILPMRDGLTLVRFKN